MAGVSHSKLPGLRAPRPEQAEWRFVWESGVQALLRSPSCFARQAWLDLPALGSARLPAAQPAPSFIAAVLLGGQRHWLLPRAPDAQPPTRPRLPKWGGGPRPGRSQAGSGGRWGSRRPVEQGAQRRRHSCRVRALKPQTGGAAAIARSLERVLGAPGPGSP